jgi:hypothetical protein
MTFSHFFPNLVNLACISLIHLHIQQFRSNILKDINLIFRHMHPIKPKGLSLGLGFQFVEYLG